jgi:hypothetical protein
MLEGPIATKRSPLTRDRMYIMPYSSWIVIQARSLCAGWVEEEVTSMDALMLKGW